MWGTVAVRRVILLVGWTILVYSVADVYGQARTGSLYGRVTDPEGQALPGVTVTLTSAVVGRLVTVTDATGDYLFPGLPPAQDYTVRFDLAGFRPVVRTDIEVRVGLNVRVDVQMAPGAEAAVVVRGQVPMVDVKKAEVATHFPDEVLQHAPVARDPWFVLSMAPGVLIEVERLDGGSEAARQSEFVARGAEWHDNQWYLDGLPITDVAVPGTSPTYFDFDAVEELQVSTGAADVEAFTGGVTVNLVTRRGQNRMSGGGRFLWANDRFQADNVSKALRSELAPEVESDRIRDIRDYGLQWGGPLRRDRLWLWVGYGGLDYDLMTPTAGDAETTGEDEAETIVAQFQHDVRHLDHGTAKLNARLGTHMLEVLGLGSWNHRQGMEADFERPPETTYRQKEQMPLVKVQDDWLVNERLFLSGKVGWNQTLDRRVPQGGTDRPGVYDYETGIWHDSYAWSDVRSRSLSGSLQGLLQRPRWLGLHHEVKFGLEFRDTRVRRAEGFANGLGIAYLDRGDPAAGGEVWLVREGRTRSFVRRWGLYAQDTVTWGRLTGVLGLRWDVQWEGILASTTPAHPLRPDWLPGGSTPDRRLPFTWSTMSPRMALSYDLRGRGTLILKASAALYPSALGVEESLGLSPTGRRELRFRWLGDANENGVPDPDEVDWTAPVFWDHEPGDPNRVVNAVASGYRSPKTLEFTVGLEGSLGDGLWTVGGTAFYRRAWDYVWAFPYDPEGRVTADPIYACWVEAGRLPPEWGGWPYYYCTVDKPAGVLWTNRPAFHTRYRGVEFRVTRRMAGRWMAFGSVTLQQNDQFFRDRRAYVDPTNVEQMEGGPYFMSGWEPDVMNNVRWMVKAGGAVELPGGFVLTGTVLARDGLLYSSVYQVPRVSNGWGGVVSVYTHRLEDKRLPTLWLVHLRVEKGFRLGTGRLAVLLDAFNVTNNAVATKKFGSANVPDLYDKVTELVSPRIFRFGLRYTL
ncbi:hypothetical protein HRbin11_01359 [bacterium HR11]|nr:hypothetical protein HRbin11_01359 [bacterium HR11]